MATLTPNAPLSARETVILSVDCNAGPHDLTFDNYKQALTVENGEAVPLTINLLGDGVTSSNCPAYGDIDVSGGYDFVVAAGDVATLDLARIGAFLGAAGNTVTLTVTGSTAPALAKVWLSKY